MKKISILASAALAVAMSITSCTSSTPKADLENEIDTLSYTMGMAQTQGLKEYLTHRMGVDTSYINEFIKGLNEGANAGDDKKKTAYFAGLQIGQQISQNMIKGLNQEIFGDDSTQTVSLQNFMAGFVSGVTNKDCLMTVDSASMVATAKMEILKRKNLEKTYADNKKKGEAFMAEKAKQPGIKQLEGGVLYEVITEGKGAIPSDTSNVKVHYEGKLIENDVVFDSSYKRNSPTTFRCNQVIPGWTTALTHMPVGSKWVVYIPQDQAYGEKEAGLIKPFSTLIFTIELLGIEK